MLRPEVHDLLIACLIMGNVCIDASLAPNYRQQIQFHRLINWVVFVLSESSCSSPGIFVNAPLHYIHVNKIVNECFSRSNCCIHLLEQIPSWWDCNSVSFREIHKDILFHFAQVFWLKDNAMIDVSKEINYIISNEGNLIINQARLSDMGNYTCGASNVASRRLSESATLTVFGEWLPSYGAVQWPRVRSGN